MVVEAAAAAAAVAAAAVRLAGSGLGWAEDDIVHGLLGVGFLVRGCARLQGTRIRQPALGGGTAGAAEDSPVSAEEEPAESR